MRRDGILRGVLSTAAIRPRHEAVCRFGNRLQFNKLPQRHPLLRIVRYGERSDPALEPNALDLDFDMC